MGTLVYEELNNFGFSQQGFIHTYFIYKTHKPGHTTTMKMRIYKDGSRNNNNNKKITILNSVDLFDIRQMQCFITVLKIYEVIETGQEAH